MKTPFELGDHVQVPLDRIGGEPDWLSDWRILDGTRWRGYVVQIVQTLHPPGMLGPQVEYTVTQADDVRGKDRVDGFFGHWLEKVPAAATEEPTDAAVDAVFGEGYSAHCRGTS